MNHAELNEFIKSYLLKGKTNGALMISAPWGTGKSFYIANSLIPYIEKTTNVKCLVVSTYGLTSLSELSDFIYKKNTNKTLSNTIKTIQSYLNQAKISDKAALGFEGINLTSEEQVGFTYKDLNLEDRLLVLEDVERSSINIIELLGYVNNLTEYSRAKIILVANEDKLISYDDKNNEKGATKVLTSESKAYVKAKEKTIRDTINYFPDVIDTLVSIINQFKETSIARFVGESQSRDFAERILVDVLDDVIPGNREIGVNLRSIIFGIEKTAEILDKISFEMDKDFFYELILGNIAFSLKWKNDSTISWSSGNASSLGCKKHALLKASYDYIVNQNLCAEEFEEEQKRYFDLIELLKKNAALKKALDVLYEYYEQKETVIIEALLSLKQLIKDGNVPESEYSKIGNYLISIKYSINSHVEIINECLDEMINSVKGEDKEFEKSVVYHSGIQLESAEAETELREFKEKLLAKRKNKSVFAFDYSKENLSKWLDYLHKEKDSFVSKRGFAKYLNVEKLAELLRHLDAKEIANVRIAFHSVYSFSNLWDFFSEDLDSLIALSENLKTIKDLPDYDLIQKLQIKWFIENVDEFIRVIRHN